MFHVYVFTYCLLYIPTIILYYIKLINLIYSIYNCLYKIFVINNLYNFFYYIYNLQNDMNNINININIITLLLYNIYIQSTPDKSDSQGTGKSVRLSEMSDLSEINNIM